MVKKKLKYIASVILMILVAITFVFSTFFRISQRDIQRTSAQGEIAEVYTLEQFQDALGNDDVEKIVLKSLLKETDGDRWGYYQGDNFVEVTREDRSVMEIPCEQIDTSPGAGNIQTAQIIINRPLTIESEDTNNPITLKRAGKDGATNNLRSLFEIIGENTNVTFKNVILDGGASWSGDAVYARYNEGEDNNPYNQGMNPGVRGRTLIDVVDHATLNVGENCTIQNSHTNSYISAHGYDTTTPSSGGAIRTDFYKDDNVDLRGGTVNLLSGSLIEHCFARCVKQGTNNSDTSYGGAVAAFDLGTINMYGGAKIQDCCTTLGGALGLAHGPSEGPYNSGVLNMYGGTIQGCYAAKGGAIFFAENSNSKLIAEEEILFENTSTGDIGGAAANGPVMYVSKNNSNIYLAPNEDSATGNVKIINCYGGTAKGSDGATELPDELKGYAYTIEFEEAAVNSADMVNFVSTDIQDLLRGNAKIKIDSSTEPTKYTLETTLDTEELGLNYQWYSIDQDGNETPISGATGIEFTPDENDESYNYGVVITSDNLDGEVKISTKQLKDVTDLSLTASKTDGTTTYKSEITYKYPETDGEDKVQPKYQWYAVDDNDNKILIEGATGPEYSTTEDTNGKTFALVVSSDYYLPRERYITYRETQGPKTLRVSDFIFTEPQTDVYDGNSKSATITKRDNVDYSGTVTVHYFANENLTEEISPEDVKEVGTYYVGITATGTDDYYEVSTPIGDSTWSFSIDKITPSLDMFNLPTDTTFTYDGNSKSVNVTVKDDVLQKDELSNAVTIKYGTKNADNDEYIWSTTAPVEVGNYKVKVETTESEHYAAGEFEVGEITINKIALSSDLFGLQSEPYIYDGKPKNVSIKEDILQKEEFSQIITILYGTKEEGSEEYSWSTTAPVEVGKCKVKVSTTESDHYASSETEIGEIVINKADPNENLFNFTAPSPDSLTYNQDAKEATVNFTGKNEDGTIDLNGMGEVTVRYFEDEGLTKEVSAKEYLTVDGIVEKVIMDAGEYYVAIDVDNAGKNFNSSEKIRGSDWKFTVTKADIKEDLFDVMTSATPQMEEWGFDPFIYDGNYKMPLLELLYPSPVSSSSQDVILDPENGGDDDHALYPVDGRPSDEISTINKSLEFFFSTDKNPEWTKIPPVDVGTYHFGIKVNDGGTNYNATNGVLTSSNWDFKIKRATPIVDMFTFSGEDVYYDSNKKEANVKFDYTIERPIITEVQMLMPLENFENYKLTGMGTISVKYSNDDGTTWSDSAPKTVGRYKVGIITAEGDNFYPTKQGEILTKDDWYFKINKSIPNLDFEIKQDASTNNEPQLVSDKKEIFYGKELKDVKDILKNSSFGTFDFKDPDKVMVPVGDQIIELTFMPNDTDNYDWSGIPGYNQETNKLDLKMPVSVIVDKSTWGNKKEDEGFVSYVVEGENNPMNGTTSIEITDSDGIHWLKETSYDVDLGRDTSTWYGIDNSSGIFERGSRFLIRWINRSQNREEYDQLSGYMDDTEAQNMPDHKKWIFVAEVIHPDGSKKYTKLDHPVPLYVQLGDDWDEGDVEAYFLSESQDERLNHEIIYSGNIATAPIKGKYANGEDIYYAKLELLHFSPYAIYDKDPVNAAQKKDNSTQNRNEKNTQNNNGSENYSKNEGNTDVNKDDGTEKNQQESKAGFNYWYLAAAAALLAGLILLLWLLYKKREKEKEVLRKTFLASLAKKSVEQ